MMTTSCGWWWLSGGRATGCAAVASTQSAGVSQAGRTHTGGATLPAAAAVIPLKVKSREGVVW